MASSATGDGRVVDASVAIKWHLTDEEYARESLGLFQAFVRGDVALAAPTEIRYEVASALVVATLGRSPRLSREMAAAQIDDFLALDITTFDDDDLIRAAANLVYDHGLAYYDALYLALAQRLVVPLVTADWRMYRLVRHLPDVTWIGDYGPAG